MYQHVSPVAYAKLEVSNMSYSRARGAGGTCVAAKLVRRAEITQYVGSCLASRAMLNDPYDTGERLSVLEFENNKLRERYDTLGTDLGRGERSNVSTL